MSFDTSRHQEQLRDLSPYLYLPFLLSFCIHPAPASLSPGCCAWSFLYHSQSFLTYPPNPFTHPCPRTPLLSLYSPLQLTILPSTHSPGRNLDVVFKPSYHHFISISSNQPPHPDLTPSKHCLDFLILCCPKFLQLWLG